LCWVARGQRRETQALRGQGLLWVESSPTLKGIGKGQWTLTEAGGKGKTAQLKTSGSLVKRTPKACWRKQNRGDLKSLLGTKTKLGREGNAGPTTT